jgi:hypothetical protein
MPGATVLQVYHPCILQTKKRYVGFSYESPTQLTPTFDAKVRGMTLLTFGMLRDHSRRHRNATCSKRGLADVLQRIALRLHLRLVCHSTML